MNLTRRILLVAIVAVSVYFRCSRLFEPWVGTHNAWAGAMFGQAARNYVKFGYGATRLAPVVSGGDLGPDKFTYYYHYPPLQVLLTSVGYRLFGDHEASARAVSLAFSVLAIGLMYVLARYLFGQEVAFLAAILLAVAPVAVYYGEHLDIHGPPSLCYSLLAIFGYARWLESGKRRDLAMCTAGIAFHCLTGWFGYFLIPVILLHHHVTRVRSGRSDFTRLWFLPAIATVICGLFFLHRHLLLQGGGSEEMGTMMDRLAKRTALPILMNSKGEELDGASSFALLVSYRLVSMYTPTVLLLVGLWLGMLAWGFRKREVRHGDWMIAVLLGMAILHSLTFPQLLKPHNYVVVTYAPGVILAAAVAIHRLHHSAAKRWGPGYGTAVWWLLLCVVVANCAYGSWRLFRTDDLSEAHRYRKQGEAIARFTPPGRTVLLPPLKQYDFLLLRYYSDRNLVTGIRRIEEALERAEKPGTRLMFVCRDQEAKDHLQLLDALSAGYGRREIDGLTMIMIR